MTERKELPEDQERQTDGDEIQIEGVETEAVVAAGRNAKATVLKIFIRDGDVRWLPVVTVLLGVIGVLTYLFFQLRPTRPEKMTALFNVAVAEFSVVDEDGDPMAPEDAVKLGEFIRQQLQISFEDLELENILTYELWGPEETGPVEGDTSEEREAAAQALAADINANVVIYGVLTFNGDRSIFSPEFYVNYASFRDGDEITGKHELGRDLLIALPFSGGIPTIENPPLAGRVQALTAITIGLAYYSQDDFENALVYFGQAEEEQRWSAKEGKEVVYLLLGNTYIRLASKEKDPAYLPAAERNYRQAFELNDHYGRALVGLAGVMYLEAIPPGGDISQEQLDSAAMKAAEALALERQPETANLETKVHFIYGQIALARYADENDRSYLEAAAEAFQAVVADYEAGDLRVVYTASHAYARLGYVAFLQGDADTAEAMYGKAIELASPYFKGEYSAQLAEIYCVYGMSDQAWDAYEEAILIADSNADTEKSEQYETRLNELDC